MALQALETWGDEGVSPAASRDPGDLHLRAGRTWSACAPSVGLLYMLMQYMGGQASDRELKKGSAELLILSLVQDRARHGYEIAKLIESRSQGTLSFQVASLYPLLYRLEARGWIEGRWVEKAGQRRRRYYRLTGEGRKMLAAQQERWRQFIEALHRVTGVDFA